MRILFFSNVYPNPLCPGAGTFNRAMIKALAVEHTVQVVSPVAWTVELKAWLKQRQSLDRSRIHLVDGVMTDFPRYYYPPGILRPWYDRFLWMSVWDRLRSTIESFQPEAIMSYWAHPDGTVAVTAAEKFGIPCISMVGGTDVLVLMQDPRRRPVILDGLKRADAVIAVSENIADCLREAGLESDRVHVVRRGVDRDLFHPGDAVAARRRLGITTGRSVLVSVGRLIPLKGFRVLIDACRQLIEKGMPIECYVLGNGPQQDELQRQISAARLGKEIRLMGPRSQDELADWYRAADCTVLCSQSEGVPNVLLESIACGTPLVATNVGGIPEIVDPQYDRLVLPDDSTTLAREIAELLCRKLPDQPRRFESPSWSDSAEAITRILVDCTRQKRDEKHLLDDKLAVSAAELETAATSQHLRS